MIFTDCSISDSTDDFHESECPITVKSLHTYRCYLSNNFFYIFQNETSIVTIIQSCNAYTKYR